MRYEMRASNYPHPDQKSGQHTNGPATIFIREDDSSPWYAVVGTRSQHIVRRMIGDIGFGKFVSQHCERLVD